MEYRGGAVTSDLELKLISFEDKYYDIYQKAENEIFVDLFRKMHSNIRRFFSLDKVQKRETYLCFDNDRLVGSIWIYHNKEANCYEVERVWSLHRLRAKVTGKSY